LNFDPSDVDLMVRAMAEGFLKALDSVTRSSVGFSKKTWRALGEAGMTSIAFDPSRGGLELAPSSVATLFEAFGRQLAMTPLSECGLVAAGIFDRCADEGLHAEWAHDLRQGRRMLALAHRERGARVATTAKREQRAWVLNGEKSLVPWGAEADAFIVTASTSEADRPVGLFLVHADADGLDCAPRPMIDGSSACALTFTNVLVRPEACLRGGLDALESVEAQATLARCAEAVGIMELLFEQTLQHLRTRTQFNRPIGSFQALQHRMVAQYLSLEQSRALLHLAIFACQGEAPGARETLAGVRAFISEASLEMGHEAIQMHGAMGVTEEFVVGRAHKRLVMLARFPTTPDTDIDRCAGLAVA
jgi:alkylation response protein AidB-like acyl-CoA dehydrogenase